MIHQALIPSVSIITPSFNQGRFLKDTILSVLTQDYQKIEYIIIDGGSSDNSVDVIKKYSSELAYWVSEPDKGQADAINKGFLRASGDFICWLNSDDLLYPHFISSRVQQFKNNPVIDIIYGDVDQGMKPEETWLRKGKQTDSCSMLKSLEIPIPQQSAIWRRKVLDVTGVLNPQLHTLLDRDFFIRIARNHKMLYIPGALAFFRVHDMSKSINEAMKWTEELPPYYQGLIDKWADYSKISTRVMAKCYWECSLICLQVNNLEKKNEFMKKAKNTNYSVFLKLWFVQFLVKLKHLLLH